MGFKNILNKIKEKKEIKKEMFRQIDNQDRIQNLIQERKLSSNERELNLYLKENYEKDIKNKLEIMRKERRDDLAFNHNPLNVKNIVSHVSWNILKEKNLFGNQKNIFDNKNLFTNKKNIFKTKGGFKSI